MIYLKVLICLVIRNREIIEEKEKMSSLCRAMESSFDFDFVKWCVCERVCVCVCGIGEREEERLGHSKREQAKRTNDAIFDFS